MNEQERIAHAIEAAHALALTGFGVVEAYDPTPDAGCTCREGSACPSPGKHPVGNDWQKSATRSPQTIAERITRRHGQYGLVPWPGERGLILDIDHPELLPVKLPPSFRVTRGKDRGHAYFLLPEGYDPKRLPATAEWGEIRVEGASRHVIGPYSRHASGDIYLPHGTPADIAEIPEEVLDQLFPPTEPKVWDNGHGPGYQLPEPGYLGSRYNAILQYVAHLWGKRIRNKEEVWASVRGVLAPLFAEPLAEPELRSRFERTWDKIGERLPDQDFEIVTTGNRADPPRPAADDERRTILAECVATFRRWLEMPDAGALYVSLATVVANRQPGDPVWLLLVAPPGGGKTEIIQPFAGLPDVHPTGTLTEASLLSGTPKRERGPQSTGGTLRQIGDFGILLHKDFGSVISMNRDTRAQVLAALREIYDGSWTRHVGTDGGRTLSWTGKVGLLAGCTPAIDLDRHYAVMGSMGERFTLYRLAKVDAERQVKRAMSHMGKEKVSRAELGSAIAAVLDVADPERASQPANEQTTQRLIAMSTLAVRCRSAVERDGYTREIQLIPEPELPARLALVLLRLVNALAAIGVSDGEAWHLAAKCALDSIPAIRRAVLEDVMGHREGVTTGDVAERLAYPTSTARRGLEDLAAHGIVRRQLRAGSGSGSPDLWLPDPWACEQWDRVLSVSEMSGGMHREHEKSASDTPISPPLRIGGDKSGTETFGLTEAEFQQVLAFTGGEEIVQ